MQLDSNQLRWLPIELDRLPATMTVWVRSGRLRCLKIVTVVSQLWGNPLALSFERLEDSRTRLIDLFSATSHIGMIRERATTVCFAMQDLDLPAFVTLKILDALCPNSIRMWAKWELITMVKHFHRRHERA
jgi:hypothetical protein